MNYNSNGLTLNEKNELDKVLASSCDNSPFWRGCATIQEFCDKINLTIELQDSCGPIVYEFSHSELAKVKEILEEQKQEAETFLNEIESVLKNNTEKNHYDLKVPVYPKLKQIKKDLEKVSNMFNKGDDKIEVCVLGRYVRAGRNVSPKIVLYIDTIRKRSNGSICLAETFVHELMHARFDNQYGKLNNVIPEIEESLVEYEAIKFWETITKKERPRYADVVADKKCLGTAHYGFGEFLFTSPHGLIDEISSSYSKCKYSLNIKNKDIQEYLDFYSFGYPWKDEGRVYTKLAQIVKANSVSCHDMDPYQKETVISPIRQTCGKSQSFYDSTTFYFGPRNHVGNYSIPDGIISIAPHAFDGSKILSVEIPGSVSNIYDDAFKDCRNLGKIRMPYSCVIERDSFKNTRIHTIELFDTVNENTPGVLGKILHQGNHLNIFLTLSSIGRSSIPEWIPKYVEEQKREYPGENYKVGIIITNPTSTIGSYAFEGAHWCTSLQISNSVKKIGAFAFKDCTGLQSITIPDSVESIKVNAFEGCSNLKEIEIPISLIGLDWTANKHRIKVRK